jgi:hypothetical protein
VTTTISDEQVQELAVTAVPFSLVLMWWGDGRFQEGADIIEAAHQRRLVSLRADGVIAILCPVSSDTLAGMAILDVPPEEARATMADDPCVRAGMMRVDVHPCHSFPGDSLPGPSAA